MEININITPKEMADLVLGIQSRPIIEVTSQGDLKEFLQVLSQRQDKNYNDPLKIAVDAFKNAGKIT